jgi:hypothetical protein
LPPPSSASWTTAGRSTAQPTTQATKRPSGYLHDPDFNGIELAWDRDPSQWRGWYGATMADMSTLNKPLDFDSLLAELD